VIATQLFYAGREREAFGLLDVDRAIRGARDTAGIAALMIWPCAELEHLAKVCRACGIEPWVWFPVLADAPGTSIVPDELVTAFDGSRGNGKIGAWSGLESGDENFLFSCPNNDRRVERVLDSCSSLMDHSDLSGIMLDRIRYPSPANGLEMLFSCFCDSCARAFRSETGHSLAPLADRARAFLQRMRSLTAQSFREEWGDEDTLWTVSGLAGLAAFRARSISSLVARFSARARSRGLKVCLDLFSPSLAGMVGQNYRSLCGMCDWVKPMIYRHARGPAGFPLEWDSLREALLQVTSLSWRDAEGAVGAALRMMIPGDGGFPADLITRELDVLDGTMLPPGVQVLAGIEAVRLPQYGIDVTESMLAEGLSRMSGRVQGIVASWNLLHIPESNLRLLGAFAARGGHA